MALSRIDAKVRVLAELGLTDTDKVRKAFVDALVTETNRYPPNVLMETYNKLLKDFYNGSTEYCK